MKQEFLTIRTKETAVRVQGSDIAAVRVKDITKKGVRVYQDGTIGIAGSVGDTPDAVLLENAQQNLSAGIAYPYPLTENLKDHRCYNPKPMSSQEVVEQAEQVLRVLREEYSDFTFSESISCQEGTFQMRSSAGLDLEYKDSYLR